MRAIPVLLTLLSLFALTACGSVDNAHPLSDDSTTVLDEGLIGYWRVDQKEQTEPDELPLVMVVGRDRENAKRLELAWLQLDSGGHIDVTRLRLMPTTLAGRRYVSVAESKDIEDPKRYAFCAYEYDAESKDRLWVSWPNVAFFARAVLDGKLQGEVEGDSKKLADRKVRLDLSTKQLRAWLEEHVDEAFKRADKPLRRLTATMEVGSSK